MLITVLQLLAVAMNESLVDSYQNALTDCAVSLAMSCGLTISINVARFITVLMNVPVVLIGLQGFKVNSLFLVACLITTTSCLPIILGLFPALDNYVHQSTAIFGSFYSVLCIALFGYVQTGSFSDGIYYCFWEAWRWPVFLIAFLGCALGIALFGAVETSVRWRLSIPWPDFTPHVHQDQLAENHVDQETRDSEQMRLLHAEGNPVIPLQPALTSEL